MTDKLNFSEALSKVLTSDVGGRFPQRRPDSRRTSTRYSQGHGSRKQHVSFTEQNS